MANQRSTFSKRAREQNLKEKAKLKQERLERRRAQAGTKSEKGPPMGEPQIIDPTPPVALPPPTPIKPE